MIMKQIGFGILPPSPAPAFLRSGRRSAPQPPRIEPDRAAPPVANFLHHVARAAWPVAPLAIPEADEIDLVGTETQGGTQHPAVVALVRILTLWRRTKLTRRDVENAARLGGKESRAPVAIGEINRLFEKRRLLKRDVKLKARAARERRFREQEVAAAGAAANAKVRRADVDVSESPGDRLNRNRLLVWRKSWLATAGRVDHMTAEQHDLLGRLRARLGHAVALR